MTRYVGADLHRRRSVIVVLDSDGTELWTKRIDNDPLTLGLEIEEVGPSPEVVLEATWGWYWAADVITEAGGNVHLAHPLGIARFENRSIAQIRNPTTTTGGTTLSVESHPQSSTENAGVPIGVVHRSQLETPPPSLQPEGKTNRTRPTKTSSEAMTDMPLREARLIAS